MSGPFRKATSIVDKGFSPGAESNEILSIEILADGFTYAILDATQYKYTVLEHFVADEASGIHSLNDRLLQSAFNELPWLTRKYQKVYIAWFSPDLVLLPGEISGFTDQKTLLEYTGQIPDDHAVKTDRLNNLNGFAIYSFPSSVLHLLTSLFPLHRLRHTGSICIESLLSMLQLENHRPDMILHIRKSSFELLLFENNRLIFFQIFNYQYFDDLLYVLFYVLSNFKLEARNLKLMLLGEISLDSDRFTRISGYFRHVFFAERSDLFRYADGFDTIPHHYFYTLLSMNACG